MKLKNTCKLIIASFILADVIYIVFLALFKLHMGEFVKLYKIK